MIKRLEIKYNMSRIDASSANSETFSLVLVLHASNLALRYIYFF